MLIKDDSDNSNRTKKNEKVEKMWQEICIFHKTQDRSQRHAAATVVEVEKWPGKARKIELPTGRLGVSFFPFLTEPYSFRTGLSLNSNINQFIIKRNGSVNKEASQREKK